MSTESIPVTVNGKVAIVTAPSYVNEKSAEAISEECSGLITDGVSLILIDMKECRMVNSVGVAIIIEIIEVLDEQGGSLGFCSLSETIAKTFQIMGLKELAGMYSDQEEALAALAAA
ncbi:MAG: hypothetical protein CME05_04005 [Gemmatimonadaceae bacterium]|nr:hypothetical protein [Gemmatimonadaceae bacterium]|tara:strand:+ start:160 stop:510 length:351 start_codon:yes stop_codon:yes gene_type:complete